MIKHNVFNWVLIGLFFVGLAFFLVKAGRMTGHYYGGDEPHYLVMAQSIVVDHDLDLAPDYASERYRAYYDVPLERHISNAHQPASFTEAYSIHGYGMGFLLAIPFALGGSVGVQTAMIGISWLVCVLLFIWLRRITNSNLVGLLGVVGLASSPFFLGLNGYIYPDLPVAALLLMALIFLDWRPSLAKYLGLSLILVVVPWLHFKTLIVFLPLALWALVEIWRNRVKLSQKIVWVSALAVPALVSFGVMILAFHRWYNVWIPTQIYPPTAKLGGASPLVTLPAMLWDADKGLLFYNPWFWLALVALPFLFVVRRRIFWIVAVATLPSIAVISTFSEWSGGYAPTGRYLAEILPVVAGAIAVALVLSRNRLVYIFAGLLLIVQSVLATAALASGNYVFLLGERSRISQRIEDWTEWSLDRYLPHFSSTFVDSNGFMLPILILASLALIVFGVIWAKSSLPENEHSRPRRE